MTDFAQLEDADGVRLSWNIWPNSKLEATKCVVPFAAMYTPNKKMASMPVRLWRPDSGGRGGVDGRLAGAMAHGRGGVDGQLALWL